MARRVVFGLRGGEYGIWVSRPNVDVLSAGDDQLLLSSSRRSAQVIASGVLNVSAGQTYGISWPVNLGFSPVILAGSARYDAKYAHTSGTTANITVGPREDFAFWVTGNQPAPPDVVRWAVLNIPQ